MPKLEEEKMMRKKARHHPWPQGGCMPDAYDDTGAKTLLGIKDKVGRCKSPVAEVKWTPQNQIVLFCSPKFSGFLHLVASSLTRS